MQLSQQPDVLNDVFFMHVIFLNKIVSDSTAGKLFTADVQNP